jgi:2-keto-4-pentenoate hydratase
MISKTSLFMPFMLFVSTLSFAASDAVPKAAMVDTQNVSPVFKKQSAVVFSKKIKNLDVKKAYHLQKAFVKNSVAKGVVIVGFKAGLTSVDAYTDQSLSEPISGVLLQKPMRGDKAVISKEDALNLMLEQEVAYQISAPITKKLTADVLGKYVGAIAPAIEIPDANFAHNDFNGKDIIANNALAYKVMIGEWQKPQSFKNLDALQLSLSCDGKILTQGKGSNALGGQSEALLWLINHIIEQGYQIQKGQVLLTGNLVKMIPAKPCVYQASFGALGNLELLVTNH